MSVVHSKEFSCKRTGEDITINTSVRGNHIIRTVMKDWQGESWTRYTIIPRQYFITKIRKMYAAQKRHALGLSDAPRSARCTLHRSVMLWVLVMLISKLTGVTLGSSVFLGVRPLAWHQSGSLTVTGVVLEVLSHEKHTS
jgi:hypothetical protein